MMPINFVNGEAAMKAFENLDNKKHPKRKIMSGTR